MATSAEAVLNNEAIVVPALNRLMVEAGTRVGWRA